MKTIFNILICVAFCITLINISGCDIVSTPYLKTQDTVKVDTTKYIRKVLLEEYTGFKCGNCPRASLVGDRLLSTYPGYVVPLKVHSGPFAKPSTQHPYDFRTADGNILDNTFGLSDAGNPDGMVNRVGYSNKSQILREGEWESAIKKVIAITPKMTIKLSTSYNAANKLITVTTHIKYLSDGSSNDYLALYITEDSIVNYQLDDSQVPPDIPNYVHNSVLRGTITGAWGEQINALGPKAGDTLTIQHQYSIPDGKDWRPEKLNIVAFIHDNGQTYEIWQAEYKSVVGN